MRTSSPLTVQQRRELEAELHRERTRLERALHAPASPDGTIGMMVESRSHARYQSIVAALERLEGATYGQCVRCAHPIPFGRLLVMPEATHCVRCGSHELFHQ